MSNEIQFLIDFKKYFRFLLKRGGGSLIRGNLVYSFICLLGIQEMPAALKVTNLSLLTSTMVGVVTDRIYPMDAGLYTTFCFIGKEMVGLETTQINLVEL